MVMAEPQRTFTRASRTERVAESVLPTRHGVFRIVGYLDAGGDEHVALTMGIEDGRQAPDAPLVRLHSECLTGDALGSRRCDCGEQLDAALARIAAVGEGALIYVRGHEGRGIGLLEKLRAYRLQDAGADTVDANLALGHPADLRDYAQSADILRDLGIARIRLMSSNPAKQEALAAFGIEIVERTGHFVPVRPENARYLRTKRARMRHDSPSVDPRYLDLATRDAWVIAQSAQSLDGFVATASGDGLALSGADDHEHLHRLRALADAVVVGAQTVVSDDPRLTVRLVAGESPVRVVLDPHGRTPTDAAVFTDGGETWWLVGPDVTEERTGPGVRTIRLATRRFEPATVVELLRAGGLQRILVEGGGRTVSAFLAADALDRLFVTTVPVFLGDGVPGVRPPAVPRIAQAARPVTRRFELGDDVCTEFVFR